MNDMDVFALAAILWALERTHGNAALRATRPTGGAIRSCNVRTDMTEFTASYFRDAAGEKVVYHRGTDILQVVRVIDETGPHLN